MSDLVEVKIPTNANPFNVTVNGKKYSYPAGATVQVPPEVAEVIEQIGRGPNLPPSSGGGGNGGGGGGDLLNEKGVIKQQHFPENFPYKEGEENVILPETTVEIIEKSASLPNLINLRVGQKYTVIWNGVEYKCEGQDYMGRGCAVGNFGEMTGVDTGEPFFIIAVYPESFDEAGIGVCILALSNITDVTQVTLSISGKTETITKIGKEYLPEGYPYSEVGEGIVLPETTITPDENGAATLTDALGLVEGQTYTVNWNGTDFECVCVKAEMDGDGDGVVDMPVGIALGNVGLMTGGDDTGEPFVIFEALPEFAAQVGAPVMVQAVDGSTSVTLSISGIAEVTTPIAQKFLPNGFPYFVPGGEVIFPETTVTDATSIALSLEIKQGYSYTVAFNGESYECTAMTLTSEDGPTLTLGNQALIGGGVYTGEPFFIMLSPDDGWVIYIADGMSSATLSIIQADTYKKIDLRYMPDAGTTLVIDLVATSSAALVGEYDIDSLSPEPKEIWKSLAQGKNISLRHRTNPLAVNAEYYSLTESSRASMTFTNITKISGQLMFESIILDSDGTASYDREYIGAAEVTT